MAVGHLQAAGTWMLAPHEAGERHSTRATGQTAGGSLALLALILKQCSSPGLA